MNQDETINRQKAMLAKLDALIAEAEQLAQYIVSRKEDAHLAIIRWGIVADEATAQIKNIEEHFDSAALEAARAAFKITHPRMWGKYAENPRRFKHVTGQEIFESYPQSE